MPMVRGNLAEPRRQGVESVHGVEVERGTRVGIQGKCPPLRYSKYGRGAVGQDVEDQSALSG